MAGAMQRQPIGAAIRRAVRLSVPAKLSAIIKLKSLIYCLQTEYLVPQAGIDL